MMEDIAKEGKKLKEELTEEPTQWEEMTVSTGNDRDSGDSLINDERRLTWSEEEYITQGATAAEQMATAMEQTATEDEPMKSPVSVSKKAILREWSAENRRNCGLR